MAVIKKKTAGSNTIKDENAQIAKEYQGDKAISNDLMNKFYGTGGLATRTSGEQSILDSRKANYDASQVQSADVTDAESALKDASKGMDSSTMQALRGNMLRSEQGQQAGSLRALKAAAGSAGITGGSLVGATTSVLRDSAMARAMGESDLAGKAATLQSQNLQNYAGFVNQADATRRASTLASLNAWSQDQLGMDQAQREGMMQTYLGGLGLSTAYRGADRGNKTANAGLKIAQNAYK